MLVITPIILSEALSWDDYYATARSYVETDIKPDKYKDGAVLKYTGDNIARMDHVLATINIESKLYNLLTAMDADLTWLVLAEPWSGDCSQVLPVLQTIASCTDHIHLRILLSDSHPDVLSSYLSGTSRSIPKLVCLRTDTMVDYGTWGPRPAPLQAIVMDRIKEPDFTLPMKRQMVHEWYAQDKTSTIQEEFINLIRQWTGKH